MGCLRRKTVSYFISEISRADSATLNKIRFLRRQAVSLRILAMTVLSILNIELRLQVNDYNTCKFYW